MTDEITEAKKIIERVLELTAEPDAISFVEAWVTACNEMTDRNYTTTH